MPDWLRLAIGTLTIARVPAPRMVDRRTAQGAMVAAPLIGLLLAVPCVAVLWIGIVALQVTPPLVATLTIGLIAVLTRALHLDGLADTADGLGSGTRNERALGIMSQSDIGPFGVVSLMFVVLVQVMSVTSLITTTAGVVQVVGALSTALVASRTALTLSCRRGIPAARPTGLGAAVAESVSRTAAFTVVALVMLGCGALGWLIGGPPGALLHVAGVAAALGAASLMTRRCVNRFGGITGDVLGAAVETAMTASLLVMALLATVDASAWTG